MELLKKYGLIAVLVLAIAGMAFNAFRTKERMEQHIEEKSVLTETVKQLTAENERLQKTIDSTENKEQTVVETIVERKDGTRVTKRQIENKQQTITKQVETKESTKETQVDLNKVVDTTKKTSVVTVTEPAGSGRLGLDISLGALLDLDRGMKPGLYLDFSYELGYNLAPRVGIVYDALVPSQLTKPSQILLGVEIKL